MRVAITYLVPGVRMTQMGGGLAASPAASQQELGRSWRWCPLLHLSARRRTVA
jgi:hypothetical protein